MVRHDLVAQRRERGVGHSSVPLPSIGIETTSTVLSGLTSRVDGLGHSPVAIACSLQLGDALLDLGHGDVVGLDDDHRGSGPPGNAAWMRS